VGKNVKGVGKGPAVMNAGGGPRVRGGQSKKNTSYRHTNRLVYCVEDMEKIKTLGGQCSCIGKVARRWLCSQLKSLVVSGDTFRRAVQEKTQWGFKVGKDIKSLSWVAIRGFFLPGGGDEAKDVSELAARERGPKLET